MSVRGPRLRYFLSWDDPDRPTARARLLIEMGAPPKRLHAELDRIDRFVTKIAHMHYTCDHTHGHVIPLNPREEVSV